MQTNPRWSGPPVRDVVWQAVQHFAGGDVAVEFAIKDIEQVALEMYPDFKVSNVSPEIAAGCVNSASRHHYSADIDRYWRVRPGVYRLYVSNQQPDLDKVLEKINEIAKESAAGDYIYRGERTRHEKHPDYGKVSSGLYRDYIKIGVEKFDMAVVQAEILKEARKYTDKTNGFEILTELQHYGGKTNLIDFTTDYLVALFFACDGKFEEPGRVILLQKPSEVDPKPYEVKKPPRAIRRAEAQKSIFVQAEKGFVEPDKVVYIPADLKKDMLDYLNKHHDISTKNIYNDLHGFIDKQRLHRGAYTELHKGFTSQERGDAAKTNTEKHKLYEAAIESYAKAIDLKIDLTEAYYNRGVAYSNTGNFEAAIEDYNKVIALNPEDAEAYYNRGVAYSNIGDFEAAIQDFNKAINLDSKDGVVYFHRGKAWLHISEWQKARADLTTAKDMRCDIITSFQNAYESVEDFEAKHGVRMPEDIVALLQPK